MCGPGFPAWFRIYIPRASEHDHGDDWTAAQGIVEEGGAVYLESWRILSIWECDL
jgi:hypothetical protein